MDVADWLRTLGLAQYETAFRENDVSAEVLARLTGEDLKEIGVSSVGHRRRLLEAIAALPSEPTGATPTAELSPERRQVTMLFCDLVGSTALSTRLDPEELRRVLSDYQATTAAAVASKRGHLAHLIGDGVLAYFGWPNADETQAESAVRAGLAIVEATRPLQLAVRIGIATGLVVVGDLIGAGSAKEFSAIGETPNLAARLQARAEPDTIVVSDATRALLGPLFEVHDLGLHKLKGFDAPQRAWQVERDTALASRSEALFGGVVTPLVGRDEELDLLLRRWRQSKTGEGRVVLLSGEPGIGKSRLLAELEARLAGEPHTSLRLFCSPHREESPLHPVIARWEQEAGFARGDSAAVRLSKLEAMLSPSALPAEAVALLAAMLSIPTEGRHPRLDLGPQRQKQQTFEALHRRLEAIARMRPVLILFEDAHWADPSSLELLDVTIERLANIRALLVISFRADFAAPWIGRAGASLIVLSRLDRRQSAALAAHVRASHSVSAAMMERILAQTDGVPLFIEELTKAVLETSATFDGSARASAVPETLQASLMARLDRLPAAKQVAQIGAVIGREFSHAVLAAVARLPEAQLARGLEEFVSSGLAFRRGVSPDVVYTFKHALVQDAAYDNLLKAHRAEIHAAIVAAAEGDDSLAIEPGVLGHHCAQAGLIAKAADYYRLAGERLLARPASAEARAQLERGLQLAASLPEARERLRLEADLQLALGELLQLAKGYPDREAAAFFASAAEAARRLGAQHLIARALRGRFSFEFQRGEVAAARSIAEELVRIADADDEVSLGTVAYRLMGIVSYWQGHFSEALRHYDASLALAARHPARLTWDWHAPVNGPANRAFLLGCLGYPERAADALERLIDDWARTGASALARGMSLAMPSLLILRDYRRLRERVVMQVSASEQMGYQQFLALGRCVLGWLEVMDGRRPEGLQILRDALANLKEQGGSVSMPFVHGLESDALACDGASSAAMQALEEGLKISRRTGQRWFDAELHRRKAELLLTAQQADTALAEQELQQAIGVARNQAAKLFEVRAATSLARLWRAQGARAEARNLLVPIYAWFTEGFDMPDLHEAREVIAQLGAADD